MQYLIESRLAIAYLLLMILLVSTIQIQRHHNSFAHKNTHKVVPCFNQRFFLTLFSIKVLFNTFSLSLRHSFFVHSFFTDDFFASMNSVDKLCFSFSLSRLFTCALSLILEPSFYFFSFFLYTQAFTDHNKCFLL